MDNNDLVSIIIPCYNQAQYLEEAVESAVHQTYPHIEIIIVDDGSIDNTEEVAEKLQKRYPETINILSQNNMGLYAARNNGIAKATGFVIVPLDADDKLYPDMVSKCMKTMEENDADIVYVGYQRFGTKDTFNLLKPFSESHPLYVTPCSATALFKKEVWATLGGYKQNMSEGYEDWEFWVNAYKHRYRFQHYPELLFYYRVKEESMFTKANKKNDYLESKIVMNHPELYTPYRVNKAINEIKETEGLADYYFYGKPISKNTQEELSNVLGDYINTKTIQDEQTIPFPKKNTNIKLYSLETLKNAEQIEALYKETTSDIVLFFAPMPYIVPSLKYYSFAWQYNKGIITAEGTQFPYVFKEIQKHIHTQFLAYQRLEQFNERKKTILKGLIRRQELTIMDQNKQLKEKERTIQKKDHAIQKKDHAIQKKDHAIQKKDHAITTKNQIIEEKNHLITMLTSAIKSIRDYPVLRHPVLKYKAYKRMFRTYEDVFKKLRL